MKEKRFSLSVKLAVGLFGLTGFGLIAYIVYVIVSRGGALPPLMWARIVVFLIASLPCYVLLANGIRLAMNIDKGDFQGDPNVKNLKASGTMLLADSCIYLVANIVFAILAEEFGPNALFAFVCLVGGAIGGVMVSCSSLLKEDAEPEKESEEIA